MGRPRKPLAEVYSQVRPVARHFVWAFLLHTTCHRQHPENTALAKNVSGRNFRMASKNYFGRIIRKRWAERAVEIPDLTSQVGIFGDGVNQEKLSTRIPDSVRNRWASPSRKFARYNLP
jgi:hypothetical protein